MGSSSGGGGGSTTTVQKADPWSGVQPYLQDVYRTAQGQFGAPGPAYYPGNTVPPINAWEQRGNTDIGNLASNPNFAIARGPEANAINYGLSPEILNPDANPYLGRYAEAIAQPITRNLTENILPSIRAGSDLSGQYGGTREGLASGLAAGRTSDAIANATAGLYSQAYGQGLDQQARTLALAPGVVAQQQATAMAGPAAEQGLGAWYRDLAQRQIDADRAKWDYNQTLPYAKLQNYAGLIGTGPGGGVTTTSSRGPSGNPVLGAVGGALQGASLANMLWPGTAATAATATAPAVAATASPALWPLLIGGGLLGAFG